MVLIRHFLKICDGVPGMRFVLPERVDSLSCRSVDRKSVLPSMISRALIPGLKLLLGVKSDS